MVKTQKKQKVTHKKTKYLRKKKSFVGGTGPYYTVLPNGEIRNENIIQPGNNYNNHSVGNSNSTYEPLSFHSVYSNQIYNTIQTPPLPTLKNLENLLAIAKIVDEKETQLEEAESGELNKWV